MLQSLEVAGASGREGIERLFHERLAAIGGIPAKGNARGPQDRLMDDGVTQYDELPGQPSAAETGQARREEDAKAELNRDYGAIQDIKDAEKTRLLTGNSGPAT